MNSTTLIIPFLLLTHIQAQSVNISPRGYENKYGNSSTFVDNNTVNVIGTVIDNFPTGYYSSLSFRPNFIFRNLIQTQQIGCITTIKISTNTIPCAQMTVADSHNPNTVVNVSGFNIIFFPQLTTSYPNGRITGAEPFTFKFPFGAPFVNTTVNNLCVTFASVNQPLHSAVPFDTITLARASMASDGATALFPGTGCGVTLFNESVFSSQSTNTVFLGATILLPISTPLSALLISDRIVAPFSFDVNGYTCNSVLDPNNIIAIPSTWTVVIPVPSGIGLESIGAQWIVVDPSFKYISPVFYTQFPKIYGTINQIETQTLDDNGVNPFIWNAVVMRLGQ